MAPPGHPETGRQSERVVPATTVTLHLHEVDLDLEVLDLSLGGFGAVSPRPFRPAVTHRFTIAVPAHGLSVTLVARAVHCRAVHGTDPLRYVTGWAFMPGASDGVRAAVASMYAALGGNPAPDGAN